MLILEWFQTAGDKRAPTAGGEKGWCCSHLRMATSDGVTFPVPADQDCGLEEMHPPPKLSHMQKSSKREHVGMGFPSLSGVYPSAVASAAGGGQYVFFFTFVLEERITCPPFPPMGLLNTSPHSSL